MFDIPLKKENILLRSFLQSKIISLNEIIKPGFNFRSVNKKNNPREYFVVTVLNKIYSLNISAENILLANDVFLSVYLYRYAYELYLKVLYIFSGSSNEIILSRLDDFFQNRNLKIEECLKRINDSFIPPKFKKDHYKKYQKMSRIVHPNIDSINIHLHTIADQQFKFLVSTINLTLWHIIEIIVLFLNTKTLDLCLEIDKEKLTLLQSLMLS